MLSNSPSAISVGDAEDRTNVIYDMCFNRTVVESAMTVKSLKVFLIDMSLTWICQKYETQLSPGNVPYSLCPFHS